MKHILVFLSIIIVSCLTFDEGAARSLYWQNFTVDATLTDEGGMLVREQQTIVFTGDWNGGERTFFIAPGQTFALTGIFRQTHDGELQPLDKGNLKKLDNWNWASANTVRWRSRLPSDPPFSATHITYVLEYRLGRILTEQEDGTFFLNHDFAFANRAGEIVNYRLNLHLAEQWQGVDSPVVIEQQHLAPGRSVLYSAYLSHRNPAQVDRYKKPLLPVNRSRAATRPAPDWLSWGGSALLLAFLIYMSIALFRHELRAKRFTTEISPGEIDEQWLNEHVFSLLPETVGATWDKTTGGHEVAAVLARLVMEGKMSSRLEARRLPFLGWKIPGADILHLELNQPRNKFKTYEQNLIDGFFIDGDTTDTKKIREYYQKRGKSFQPADKIRHHLRLKVKKLTEAGRSEDQSKWLSVALVMMLSLVIFVFNAFIHKPELPFTIASGISCILGGILGASGSMRYKFRADHLFRRILIVHLIPLLALLFFVGLGFVGISTLLTLGLLIFYVSLIYTVFTLAKATDTPEGILLRKYLAAAREYLRRQLRAENPLVKDEWFPYLLAFGLGPNVDKWTKQFGDQSGVLSSNTRSYSSSASSGNPGFSGGGGHFGGAGASGAWAAAATSLGVSTSSSSGSSGGGGGSSGGGGGGGW